MSDDLKLKIEIDATGAARAASEINKVTDATKKTTEATKANAQAVETQAKATKAATPAIGAMGQAVAIAGNTVGQFNHGAGQMVSRIGALGGALQSLTTAGLGPLGMALAAINIALPLASRLMAEFGGENLRASSAVDTHVKSLDDLIAAQRRLRDEQERTARVRAGRGTAEEQQAYLDQGVAELSAAQARNADPGVIRGMQAGLDVLRRFAQEAAAREAAARNDAALREENARNLAENQRMIAAAGGAEGGVSAGRGGGRARAQGPSIESLMGGMGSRSPFGAGGGLDDYLAEQERLEEEAALAAIEAQKARDAEEYEARLHAEQKITELLAEEEARRTEIAAQANEQRIADYQNTAAMIQSIGSSTIAVAGFIDDAMAKADESDEQRQKRMLKRKAFDQSIEGIINTANSAASFARMDYPAGVTYAVAAGLNFAAAAKAGVDAGNVRAAGPSGGGDDGGQQRRDNTQRESAEPKTIVINMNGPVVAATDRAELGRQLGQLVNEGQQRYG